MLSDLEADVVFHSSDTALLTCICLASAQVYGPHGEAHYAVQRQKQGTFTAMAQASGLYRVCFSNRMSTLTEKVVAFSLHTGDDLYRDVAKKEHISPLENEVTQLADAVTAVEDEQKYMWARERAARDSELLQRGVHRICRPLHAPEPAPAGQRTAEVDQCTRSKVPPSHRHRLTRPPPPSPVLQRTRAPTLASCGSLCWSW